MENELRVGDTDLVALEDDNKTMPFQLLEILCKGRVDWVRLRTLAGRADVDPKAKGVERNEVVWTDEIT